MTLGQFRSTLSVPVDTLRITSQFFRAMRDMEACCFWFGPRDEHGSGMVQAVVIPEQQNNRGHYHITADAMLQVVTVARGRGWKNLAQTHSHPGPEVRHSSYDDDMANSRRALSLVFPSYGSVRGMWRFRGWLWDVWPDSFPPAIGVHAFLRERWTLLPPNELGAVLRLVAKPKPAFIDLRP